MKTKEEKLDATLEQLEQVAKGIDRLGFNSSGRDPGCIEFIGMQLRDQAATTTRIADAIDDISQTLDAQLEESQDRTLKNLRAIVPALIRKDPGFNFDEVMELALKFSRKMIEVSWNERRREEEEQRKAFKSPIAVSAEK